MYQTHPDSTENIADRVCSKLPCPIRSLRQFYGRLIWIVAASATVLVSSLGAAELSIPTQVAHGGSVVSVSVGYRAQGADVADLEFDLEYDPSALTITAEVGSAAASAGKFLAMNVLSSGHIRFLIVGLNRDVIGDGSVVVLTIQVSANSLVGPHQLDIFKALGADPSGQTIAVETQSGRIVRVGPP
jgi:hypothetical protein